MQVFIIAALLSLHLIAAFRPNAVRPAKMFVPKMATTDVKEANFKAIRDGINQALTAKVQAGQAPAKFVEIVRGFVDEYAQTYVEANESPEAFQYHVGCLLKVQFTHTYIQK